MRTVDRDASAIRTLQRRVADMEVENDRLRALIKALCSDPSPFGSEEFRKVRDQINDEHRALLLDVLR